MNNSSNVFNTTRTILGILLISILFLGSCKSDEPEEEQQEQNQADGEFLSQKMLDNRVDAVQTYNIDPTVDQTITGNKGTMLIIPANSIGLNGTAVTGNIDVELIEIYSKAQMLFQNKSTLGKKANGDEEALKSAGEFFINAKQSGTQLELLNTIDVRSKTLDFSQTGQMNVFKGGDDINDTGLWTEADDDNNGEPDQAELFETDNGVGFGYGIEGFGWSNLDRWYNFQGQLTDLFVDAPDGYNNTNCALFLSYDGENALARMDVFDTSTQLFTEHYGRIPVGQEVHFIMVATINEELHYAIQSTTITNNHVEVIPALQPISGDDFAALVNALP